MLATITIIANHNKYLSFITIYTITNNELKDNWFYEYCSHF